jgi:uncharacterized phiE125 gp8 family phage protein
MGSRISVEPDGEPITLEQAKLHLRVSGDSEDSLIQIYMASARRWVEEYIHRALLNQTWETKLDGFPLTTSGAIRLPMGRASAINSVKYLDSSGVEQTLTGPTSGSPGGTDYQEDLSSDEGAIIMPPPDGSWPSTEARRLAAVTINFVAGYGTKGADVPQSMITGILYRLTDLYEFRGSVDGNGTATAKLEIQHYRMITW